MAASVGHEFAVASFVGKGCSGNLHRVYVNPASPQQVLQASPDDGRIKVLLFTGEDTVRAEFFQLGRAILRCGSGSLAAAHVLHHELGRELGTLETSAGQVVLRRQGEWLGYAAQGLPVRTGQDLSAWQQFINKPALGCWDIGGDEDYCLLELEDQSALATLKVNTAALSQFSHRALIVTAAADTGPFDYVLRYFAPQHGKPEDPATGSANLQLGSFWQSRLQKTKLHGRQLSAEGGEFLLEVEADRVWVMGRTALVENL